MVKLHILIVMLVGQGSPLLENVDRLYTSWNDCQQAGRAYKKSGYVVKKIWCLPSTEEKAGGQ